MKNFYLIVSLILLTSSSLLAQDSIPVTINAQIMTELLDPEDDPFHLRITDTLTNLIWYDSLSTVYIIGGFKDTVYLDSGIYRCEIIGGGAYVADGFLKLNNGQPAPWINDGWYYLIDVPAMDYNTYSNISITSCNSYLSPSFRYTWNSSGMYSDTLSNSTGNDSIISIDLTIVSIDSTLNVTEQSITAIEPGAQYQWLACNSGSIIVGANSQSYSPSVNGLYSVIITKNGCQKTSACYTYLLPNPNDCDSLNTTQNVTACASYDWNGNTHTNSGTYTYTDSDSSGCEYTQTLILIINPNPEQLSIEQFWSTTFKAGESEGYQWYLNGEELENETTEYYNFTKGGVYNVESINSYGCKTLSEEFVIGELNKDLSNEIDFSMYPNPTNQLVNIELQKELGTDYLIIVTDIVGRTLINFDGNRNNTLLPTIDLNDLAKGSYQISIKYNDGIGLSKTVIKN